jgi:hypothetical protein
MSKSKKTITEKVKDTVKKAVSKDLLRDASTGVFSEGTAPAGKSPSGNRGGVPFWEV